MKKILANFTSKSEIRPELQKAYIKDGYMYATDSFKAIKINVSTLPVETQPRLATSKTPRIVPIDALDLSGDTETQYPDINAVIPDTDTKDYIRMTLSLEYLEKVCSSLKSLQKLCKDKKDVFRQVDIYVNSVHTTSKPLVFKTRQATALLMPINK